MQEQHSRVEGDLYLYTAAVILHNELCMLRELDEAGVMLCLPRRSEHGKKYISTEGLSLEGSVYMAPLVYFFSSYCPNQSALQRGFWGNNDSSIMHN